jgi:O-antigen/teichoic acid export membrane protein
LFHKVRELTKDLAIYGVGDVAVSVVNFLLLSVYVKYLDPSDYGVLAQLGAVEVVAKIVFRCGLDGSFMRFYYDYPGERDRQRLASTIFFFLLALNSVLLVAAVAAAPAAGPWLFEWEGDDRGSRVLALQLVLANTFAIGFTFLPFHLLRMQKRAAEFSALTLARSVSTLLLRIALVVGFGYGVMGVVVADLAVTALVLAVLSRWFAPLLRPLFSRAMLRESLAFGLPRLPHAFAQQVMAVGDRFILSWFRTPIADIGVYSMGATFALAQKLFLSAFEYAWAPFYYATAKEPDGKRVFPVVATYAFAVLVVMTAGLSAIAGDLLPLMLHSEFPHYAAATSVIPGIAVGVLLQGVYLLTSIGLNITKQTAYYPVSTAAAAAASIVLNLALIPRFGILGAAWANAAAYGVQAAVAYGFSQRFYPIEYEWARLFRVGAAALLGYLVARRLPAMAPLAGVLARGGMVVAVTGGVLWLTGFFEPAELAMLRRLRRRPAADTAVAPPPDTTEFAGEIVAADVRDDVVADERPSSGRMVK